MADKRLLRDLIYFDFEKTASIVSQMEGGLITTISEEEAKHRQVGGAINVQLAQLGGDATNRSSKIVARSVHHDLLVRAEEALIGQKAALDVNDMFSTSSPSIAELRKAIANVAYLRVQGISEFQDYERVKRVMTGMVSILPFMESDSRRNSQKQTKRMLEGFGNIIDLIMPNRCLFATQPFDELKSFRVNSNLKHECFVDSDRDNVIFHYGSQPDIQLTVFGQITSSPESESKRGSLFDSAELVQTDGEGESIGGMFNQVFAAIAPLEEYGQVTRFPSVTMYPLAVYRTVRL